RSTSATPKPPDIALDRGGTKKPRAPQMKRGAVGAEAGIPPMAVRGRLGCRLAPREGVGGTPQRSPRRRVYAPRCAPHSPVCPETDASQRHPYVATFALSLMARA